MNKNKRIRIKHLKALRDLGRCFAFNGTKVKRNVLYRSGYLGKLTNEEAKDFVETFNVGTVIDLRTVDEANNAHDISTDLVKYYHLPILDNFDNPLVTKENRNSILMNITKNKGGSIKYLGRVYRKMVSDPYCLNYLRQAIDIILNNEDGKAIVFHCTQGKDRTGVLAASILIALGVDKASVINDYRRFNNAYRTKNFAIAFVATLRFFSFKTSKDLYYLMMAHRKLMLAMYDEIEKVYGNTDNFIEKGLLLDKEKLEKFREKYLYKE